MGNNNEELFTFVVNGIEIKTTHEKLVAADILKLAVDNGAIQGKPEDYILESDEPEHTFKDDDWVDFREYKEFITEKSGATPVALNNK